MKTQAVALAGCMAVCLQSTAAAGAAHVSVSTREINQAVIAALPVWHGQRAQILEHLDLSRSFATVSPWALVVAQDPTPPPADVADFTEHGPVAVCFVKVLTPHCTEAHAHGGERSWWASTYDLRASKVVYTGPGRTKPLLLLQTCSPHGLNGSCDIRTALFAYDRKDDHFRQIFVNDTGSNNNQETRFVEHGPLRGDVIANYPTGHAPYTYWIEVYARGKSGKYARILRYRGRTGYDDGNRLAVADSEMPEILRRLGLWRPGDALPVPARMPKRCTHLFMRHEEEWCQSPAESGRTH